MLFVGNAQSDVVFQTKKHSFGKIPQGKPVTFVFKFTNNSTKPILVEKADAECGCTKPVFPIEPIMKGQSNQISVTYNAADVGSFSKKVSVKFANADAAETLIIEGEVLKNK